MLAAASMTDGNVFNDLWNGLSSAISDGVSGIGVGNPNSAGAYQSAARPAAEAPAEAEESAKHSGHVAQPIEQERPNIHVLEVMPRCECHPTKCALPN